MSGGVLIQAMCWGLYPFVIFFGLRFGEPRTVALILALTLLMHRRRTAGRLLRGVSRADLAVMLSLLLLAGATALTNSETLLRGYPAAMNAGMLVLFGGSLLRPPSMVERFARLAEPQLSPAGVRYTRRVTQVWCGFFIANGGIALWTAFYASREQWALYNGFIAYILMGSLFVGERLVRFHVRTPKAPR